MASQAEKGSQRIIRRASGHAGVMQRFRSGTARRIERSIHRTRRPSSRNGAPSMASRSARPIRNLATATSSALGWPTMAARPSRNTPSLAWAMGRRSRPAARMVWARRALRMLEVGRPGRDVARAARPDIAGLEMTAEEARRALRGIERGGPAGAWPDATRTKRMNRESRRPRAGPCTASEKQSRTRFARADSRAPGPEEGRTCRPRPARRSCVAPSRGRSTSSRFASIPASRTCSSPA